MRKPCSHLISAFAFFFDLCRQMQRLSMSTIICCHSTHSRSLSQTQTFSVNKAKIFHVLRSVLYLSVCLCVAVGPRRQLRRTSYDLTFVEPKRNPTHKRSNIHENLRCIDLKGTNSFMERSRTAIQVCKTRARVVSLIQKHIKSRHVVSCGVMLVYKLDSN